MNDPWCNGRHEPRDCGDEWCDTRDEFMRGNRSGFDAVQRPVDTRHASIGRDGSLEMATTMPVASPPQIPDPMRVRCSLCGACAGAACNQQKVVGSLDGFHAARVRLATEGAPVRASREVDEYNRAVRQRERRGGWR